MRTSTLSPCAAAVHLRHLMLAIVAVAVCCMATGCDDSGGGGATDTSSADTSGDDVRPDAPIDADGGETDTADGSAGDTRTDNDGDSSAGDADASGDAADSGDASEVPLITDAGLCDVPANPRLSVTPGTDLWKVTLDDPDALCNDGSPGIFYISPAPAGSADADKWIIWLEGGGGCNGAASCGDRWCGVNPIYTAGKMSSRYAPDGVEGRGIFDRAPGNGQATNDFAGYNMVMAYYCSSDNWSGRAYQEVSDDSGTYPDYALHIKGAHIVTAMLETLKTDVGATSDAGDVTLPDLDDASQVLFMGTSAGGGGVRNNADRVGEMLIADNPDLDFRLVVDAGVHPKTPLPPDVTEADVDAVLDNFADVSINFRDAITDSSCLEWHADAANDPDTDTRLCYDNTHVLLNHITTPWYAKMDLSDNANSPGIYPDGMTFSQVVFDMLQALAQPGSTAEETDAQAVEPGIFAPNCGHHVNLEVGDFYRIQLTRQQGNMTLSNHDVLSNWVSGSGATQVIHNPNDGVTSVCP